MLIGVDSVSQHFSILWVCRIWNLFQLGVGSALVMADRRLSDLSWVVMLLTSAQHS